MKFLMTLKSPDCVADGIRDAAEKMLFEGMSEEWQEAYYNLAPHQRAEALEQVTEQMNNFTSRWIRWGEYVTLIFDTETGTCEVKPVVR